jgi:putative transposase
MLFKPFHERRPVRIYFTTLPHWRQNGCTYFVTYRMGDSIPQRVLEQWEREKLQWLLTHGIEVGKCVEGYARLDPSQQRAFMKEFNRKLNTYLDEGHGSCALSDPRCQQVVAEGWEYFQGQRYELGELVVMPNHVHLLITPLPGYELEDILQSRKRQSAREINAYLGRTGDFWQKHSYDHIVRDEVELGAFRRYIAENPVKARLREGEYWYRGA